MPNKKDLNALKNKLIEDRKKARKSPPLEISETGFYRMNGPIGIELTEEEWKAMKLDALSDDLLDRQ